MIFKRNKSFSLCHNSFQSLSGAVYGQF